MKLTWMVDVVFKLFREMQGKEKIGPPCPRFLNPKYVWKSESKNDLLIKKFIPFAGLNYLIINEHKGAPTGFALRGG